MLNAHPTNEPVKAADEETPKKPSPAPNAEQTCTAGSIASLATLVVKIMAVRAPKRISTEEVQ
jgi:hypothetical protein